MIVFTCINLKFSAFCGSFWACLGLRTKYAFLLMFDTSPVRDFVRQAVYSGTNYGRSARWARLYCVSERHSRRQHKFHTVYYDRQPTDLLFFFNRFRETYRITWERKCFPTRRLSCDQQLKPDISGPSNGQLWWQHICVCPYETAVHFVGNDK